MFVSDERGLSLRCTLFAVDASIRVYGQPSYNSITRSISHIHHDLWQIGALVSRLAWMRQVLDQGDMDESAWRVFSQLDIEAYFINARSILDYASKAISKAYAKPDQLPTSFSRLRNSHERYRGKLSATLIDCLAAADWFDDLKNIRDGLVHSGASSLVFSDKSPRLLFQINSKSKNLVSRKFMLHNDNVAYFDCFVSWSFSHILTTLEIIGSELLANQELVKIDSRSYSFGYETIHQWIRSDLASICST